ncbi:MAG: IS66 family transposase [Bacteroides thetaiotaomicron]
MSKALNYLKNFWNQIFAYRNDGEYSIDNMAAERAIRPITVQRKNSLFFGSVKGIQNSAIYNTFIETCKQAGVSFRDYFCKLLRELKKGKNGLRKPSSHDNMQIIIVKFVDSFLDGCRLAPV